MIPRQSAASLERLAKGFPVVALTGPRQSGKTTLARALFRDKAYVSLESPDERDFAQTDPRGFLKRFPDGAIIDEVQRCPALLSWLQGWVDERRRMGDFVLTGSAQLDLMAGISQSLAGRVGRVELLPLSVGELREAGVLPPDLPLTLYRGAYPALYDRPLEPADWYASYVATYLERDVRQLLAVRDLSTFQLFLRMCASRTGQLLNLASLASDCGINGVTARQWLSVLEASYVVRLLRPYHRSFGKRLVKTPKLYFLDAGLASWLLGIRDAAALHVHASRGALFETWVVSELAKHRTNAARAIDLHFWRDHQGMEVDVVWESPEGLEAVEIKSGSTFASDWPDALRRWQRLDGQHGPAPSIIYGGDDSYERQGMRVVSWRAL